VDGDRVGAARVAVDQHVTGAQPGLDHRFHGQHQVVVRGDQQRAVKAQVGLGRDFSHLARGLAGGLDHGPQRAVQVGEFGPGPPPGRQPGRGRLDDRPDLRQMAQKRRVRPVHLGLPPQQVGVEQVPVLARPHRGAVPRPRGDHALGLQNAQRFPDHRAAHVEFAFEPLRVEHVARRRPPADQPQRDRLHGLPVQPVWRAIRHLVPPNPGPSPPPAPIIAAGQGGVPGISGRQGPLRPATDLADLPTRHRPPAIARHRPVMPAGGSGGGNT
jgi:hypothetical protein